MFLNPVIIYHEILYLEKNKIITKRQNNFQLLMSNQYGEKKLQFNVALISR